MTFDHPAAQRAARRSGALAGIGLLWVALLASVGLLWAALGAVAATAVGILAVLLGTWRPHLDVRRLGRKAGRSLAAGRARAAATLGPAASGLRRGSRTALERAGRATSAGATRSAAWSRRAATAGAVHVRAAAGTTERAAAAGWSRARDGRPELPAREAIRSRAQSALESLRPAAPARADGRKLAHESVRLRREGHVDEAVAVARQAVPAFQATSDPHGEALALNTLALALAQAQRYQEAVEALDGALTLLAATGDRHREGTVLVNLGTLHRQAGGLESARFCWRKALERLDPASPESHETERLLRAS